FSFLQLIGVGETDAEAEDLYAEHAEYFFHKLLYTPSYYQAIPGCLEYEALVQSLRHNPRASINLRELKAKDLFGRGFVVVGSPCASSSSTASSACAWGTCSRSCTSAPCRLRFARRTSICLREKCCRISRTCGTTSTRTAGGPNALRPSVLPPPWPPLRRSW